MHLVYPNYCHITTIYLITIVTLSSIQPKSTARLINQYSEHPQPDNSIATFQPSVKYSLLGPSYDCHLKKPSTLKSQTTEEEEQIYEVLDPEEDNRLSNATTGGMSWSVTISEDKSAGLYNRLQYSEKLAM